MNLPKIVWNLFSIHRKEFGFALPLFVIYFLSGSFFTVGQIFTETLFLKAYGAKGFSRFFVQNGVALILAGILYNYFIVKVSLHRGYVVLTTLFTTLILSASFLMEQNLRWTAFYVYMGNYLCTFFLDMHFFNYSFQFLSIRNSKRILPFIMGGGKLGGVITSFCIYSYVSRNITNMGFFLWSMIGILLLIAILVFNVISKKKYLGLKKQKYKQFLPNKNLLDQFYERIKVTSKTPIFLYSMLFVFFMSIANQLSEYYFALSFNKYFVTKSSLAEFLSMYTFVADFFTLIVQIFITARIIKILGVKKTNYIYPVSFLSFIAFFMFIPGLAAGVLLRFFRKNLSLIIRTPVFNIIMASSPRDRMAEVKSFIGAIISPLGMIVGGMIILLMYKKLSPMSGYIVALGIGIVLTILTFLQNRSYVRSLQTRISYEHTFRYEEKIHFNEYANLFKDDNSIKKNLSLIEEFFHNNPSLDALQLMYVYFDRLNQKTKEKVLYFLKTGRFAFNKIIISSALRDSSMHIRSIAYSLLLLYPPGDRHVLLEEKNNQSCSEAENVVIDFLRGQVREEDVCNELLIIKDSILLDQGKPILPFIMLCSVLPFHLYINDLVDVTLHVEDPRLFKLLTLYAENIKREQALRLLDRFKDKDINPVISFLLMNKEVTNLDKFHYLEHRDDLTEKYMENLFRYNHDEQTKDYIIKSLFETRTYNQKANYLNYLMAINLRMHKKMRIFIDYEVTCIREISEYSSKLSSFDFSQRETRIVHAFLLLCLSDIIELHKHLILKAMSIMSGISIDDVYESNILLKDKELNSVIFEYIESSVSNPDEIIPLLENNPAAGIMTGIVTIQEKDALLHKIKSIVVQFLPEIEIPGKFIYQENASKGKLFYKYKKEAQPMLDLLEKILHLKENNLFKGLKVNELIYIAKITNEVEIPPQEVFIDEGEQGDELFIIIEGEVEVYSRDKVLSRIGAGSCIGELSVIDSEPRSTNVKTVRPSRFLSIKRKDFLITMRDNPAISINIMKILAERVRMQNLKV